MNLSYNISVKKERKIKIMMKEFKALAKLRKTIEKELEYHYLQEYSETLRPNVSISITKLSLNYDGEYTSIEIEVEWGCNGNNPWYKSHSFTVNESYDSAKEIAACLLGALDEYEAH